MTARQLRDDEKRLIRGMLQGMSEGAPILRKLDAYQVEEMKDGRMGSLRVISDRDTKRHFGKILSEVRLSDEDGVPVVASVIVDSTGDLYELDMWKVDFSPLKRFPELEG